MQLDETDHALIAALSENARTPVADLARKLGLARTTVQARLDRLESRGAIAGYTLRRGEALKPMLRATVLIAVAPHESPTVLTRLRAIPEVETVHTTSGRFDLLVTLTADSTAALDATLDRIGEAKGVRSSESLIHLSTKIDRSG
ncbi:Lrp/AsnC family transcriptional regulator [Sagittula sp. NFXS13]|uniref:Lrp/AsnC family transcriptional regulator n=1 Tax=Sagittula sp. NFXS13 TaxID=2819095 RepID=UPI0032DF785C